MRASLFTRAALAVALSSASVPAALAGGGRGGAAFHFGGGFHGGFGGHGGWGGGGRGEGMRGLPPVAGIIHERAGTRPYVSAYGHTNTAVRFDGFAHGAVPAYGHTATALPPSGAFRPYGAGYGHLDTGPRFGAGRRLGEGRRRFVERGGFGLGGGYGGGYGFGDGGYGAPGSYGDAGTYGGQGTYGQPGTYGGEGTTATQDVYGNGGGASYRSETPLAARFAEPPLAPSPYAPYSPGDRYAYAAAADVGPGPRVVNPFRAAESDCACGTRREPVIYRYGIGTAY